MQCDASIKAIIVKIDSEKHDFVIEDLDDETCVIKESKLAELKLRLNDVRGVCLSLAELEINPRQILEDTQMQIDDSGSD